MFEGIKNFLNSMPDKNLISGKKVETIGSTARKNQEKPLYKSSVNYDENLDKEGLMIKWGENTDNSNSGTREAYKTILNEQLQGNNFQKRPDAIPFKKTNHDEIDLQKTRDKIEKIKPAA